MVLAAQFLELTPKLVSLLRPCTVLTQASTFRPNRYWFNKELLLACHKTLVIGITRLKKAMDFIRIEALMIAQKLEYLTIKDSVLRCKAVNVWTVGLTCASFHCREAPLNTLFDRLGQFAKWNRAIQLSRYSDKATGWTSEEPWFDCRQRQEIPLFSKASRLALESTQPPMQ